MTAAKQTEIDKLNRQLHKRKVVAFTDWPEAFKGFIEQAQKAKCEILNAVDTLAMIRQEAMQVQTSAEGEA